MSNLCHDIYLRLYKKTPIQCPISVWSPTKNLLRKTPIDSMMFVSALGRHSLSVHMAYGNSE